MKARLRAGAAIAMALTACNLISGIEEYTATNPGGQASVGGRSASTGSGGEGNGGNGSDGGGIAGSGGAVGTLTNGEVCVTDQECVSASCVDDRCCDRPCDVSCEACRAGLTGLPDGQCGPVLLGSDPDLECAGRGCVAAGLCCGDAPVAPGGACPATCTGGCSPANVCVIACGDDACIDSTISCPAGFACTLHCTGNKSCRGATLECPSTYPCQVDCADENQNCTNFTINCADGVCDLLCPAGACGASTLLNCGTNRCQAECLGNSKPTMSCGSSCDCIEP